MFAVITSASTLAHADPSLSDRETARSLMEDGDAKRDKGDWRGALKNYEAADAIMHVPTTGFEMARAQAELGLLLEARDTLGRVVRLPQKPNEPPPFVAARKAADALNNELAQRIPSITLTLVNADPSQSVQVFFDGQPVPLAAAEAPRKVNPGDHVIAARMGTIERRSDVHVGPGDARAVSLDMARAASDVAAGSNDSAAPSHGMTKALVYGGFGVGALGVGIGSVTGLMSILKTNDVKDDCNGTLCPRTREGDVDSAKSLGNLSTVAFIVGGAGIATGIVGLVLSSKEKPVAEPSVPSSARRVRPFEPTNVQAVVTPTWAGLAGSF